MLRCVLVSGVLLSLAAVPAAAVQGGEVSGGVVDATGGALPGATVTLRGGPAGARSVQTDAEGRFTFTGVPAGEWVVTVFLSGFGEVTVEGVAVDADRLELPAVTLRLAAFEEAVVVTATRIEEPLQEVPMSISAVTGADIERRTINDLTELARWTPGLTAVDQGPRGTSSLIVRGLNTDSLGASEAAGNSSVATYLGDIPLGIDLRLRDIERVEVLLGPQGSLYGAGTLAGAVRYLPRRPDTERRSLEVRGDLFSLSHGGAPGSDAGLTFNVPLVSRKLALRGVVDRFSDPGFIDYDYLLRQPGVSLPEPDRNDPDAVAANLRSEPDANTEDTLSARFSLLWDATPTFSTLFAYHLQDQRVGGRQVNHAASFDTGRYVSASRYLEPLDRKDELFSVELNWAPGAVALTSAAGYSRSSSGGQRDQTDLLIQAFGIGGLLPPRSYPALEAAQALDPTITGADLEAGFRTFSAFTREDQQAEQLSWETRVVTTGDGPWHGVGGFFFSRADSDGASSEFAPGLTEFSGITPILSGQPQSNPIEYYSFGTSSIEERALFGEISHDLGDRWQLTAGGRWFGYSIGTGSLTEFPYTPFWNSPWDATGSEDSGLLAKGSVSYQIDAGTNVYFTRSQGYRIGGSNNFRVCTDEEIALLTDADPDNDPPQPSCVYEDQLLIKPDTTTNYEVGLRRSWSDERVTLGATVFQIDWTDIQVDGLTPFSEQGITINGGGAVSRGFELASSASLTNAFRLRGSWSFTRAEITLDSPGLVDGEDALAGDRLSGAPQQQGSLLASYATLVGRDMAFTADYGYTYIGDVLTRIGLRASGETLPAYDLHNLSASISKDAWTLTFYAQNLLNEYAVTSVRQTHDQIGLTTDGFVARRYFANVIAPRRAGVRLRYAFQ